MTGMKTLTKSLALALASLATLVPSAQARVLLERGVGAYGSAAPGVLQCVPYARSVTGIRIYGDAHTWWGQAAGKYPRGREPRVGAVMAIRPHGNSRLGHVAAVSRIIDERTVLLRHANWSSPGQIENDVRAVDVSPDNDWSEVRIWFGPSKKLGARRWPLYGFIYKENNRDGSGTIYKPARFRENARRGNDLIGDIIAGRFG
jgi:surface antigen